MPRIPPSSVNRQAVQTSLEQMGKIKNKDASLRIKLTDGKASVRSGSAKGHFKGFAINKQTLIKKTINQQLDLVAFINTACTEAKLPVHLDCRSISVTEGMAILSAVMEKHNENARQATVTSILEDAAGHKDYDQYATDIVNNEHDISFLTQLREVVADASVYHDYVFNAIDARIQALSPSSIENNEKHRRADVTISIQMAAKYSGVGQYVENIVNKEDDIAFLTQLRDDVATTSVYDDTLDVINARIETLSPSSIENNEKSRRAGVTSALKKTAAHSGVGKQVEDIVNKEDDVSFLTQLRDDVANNSVYDDTIDAIDARIEALSSSSLDATQSSTEADIAEEIKLENGKLADEIFNDLETITQEQIIPNQEILKMTEARKKKFRYRTDQKIAKVPVATALKLPTSGDEEVQRFHGNVVQLHPSEPISIATQAPMPDAQGDFWLANFNNDAKAIVDLTQAQDLANNRVHIYYPTGSETLTFESGGETLQVSLKEQSIHPENSDIQRCEYLVVDGDGNEKLIERVHYTGWVDFQGVEAQVLNQLIDTVDHVAGKDGVVTVHCSAGVGRTGTFITARTAKHQLAGKAMDSAQIKKEIVDLGKQGRIQRNRAFIQKPQQMLTLVEFFQDLSNAAPADTSQATAESIDQPSSPPPRPPRPMSVEHFWKHYDQYNTSSSTPEEIWANVAKDLTKVASSHREEILNEFEAMTPGAKSYLTQRLSNK